MKYYSSVKKKRIILKGETFVHKTIQFKIIASHPQSGCVVSDTVIHFGRKRIGDLFYVTILPIHETLPSWEKNLPYHEVLKRYVEPFLAGNFSFICCSTRYFINGICFATLNTKPKEGYFSSVTKLNVSSNMFLNYTLFLNSIFIYMD